MNIELDIFDPYFHQKKLCGVALSILSQILLEDSLILTKLKSIMQNCMVEES